MAEFGVKDVDLAAQKAAQLKAIATDLQNIYTYLIKGAEDADALTQTARMNEKAKAYLLEDAEILKSAIPQIEQIGAQLTNAVNSMQAFQDALGQDVLAGN